ncbi:phage head closure protein [Tumebacillus sp. DT12]|uniref:Phage head closure protein n=1 Tax=Tumebacillus lacus TaxID=2995335 RepID=A0ABT3X0H4_9BACL|nr:phage head closure protein [Tumebacillus lacus]MCX7570408.1 phage head closure protein [Tumebacillus lacus]
MFKPAGVQQFATPIRVQKRVISHDENGASITSYQDAEPALDFCSWKGKGGTQTDAFTITDTAEVTMWFRPDIAEMDRVMLNDDESKAYDILNVENLDMRNMWLKLKVGRAVQDWPHLIKIQVSDLSRDADGLAVETWRDHLTIRGAVEPLQGREYDSAAAVNAEVTVRVRIRFQSGITSEMRLVYDGRIFNIKSVIDPGERHNELHLMCTEVVGMSGS